MTDHALDARKLPPQRAFDFVDSLVHLVHGQQRIDAAMKVHHLAVRGLAYAHIVDLADERHVRGDLPRIRH